MQILPDLVPTLWLTLPFLVTMIGLHVLLFKPVLAYLEEREEISGTSRKEAEELDTAAEAHLVKIEELLVQARHDIGETRKAARHRAHEREAEILAAARAAAEERVAGAVEQIKAQQDGARTALDAAAAELSTEMASRALGRSVA